MPDPIADLLSLQAGVISRRQFLATGMAPHDLKRLQRQRDLVRVHAGVFVNHTGELTCLQRAWAGVLFAWPAALAHESAIRAADGPGRRGRDDAVIHIAVGRKRTLELPPGLRLHRLADLGGKVQWNASPPRIRLEHAVIDVAAEATDDFAAVSVLAQAVQSRLTRAGRLVEVVDSRQRPSRRVLIRDVLSDIDMGACSVLEHGYLSRVERAHGLPLAARQVRASSRGVIFRDVVYDDLGQVVELDGRLFHDTAAARDADLERDLDAAVDRLGSVRIGWGQVFGTTCLTAVRIGRLLQARGWQGQAIPCAQCAEGWPLAC